MRVVVLPSWCGGGGGRRGVGPHIAEVHAERCFTLVVNSRAVVFEAIDAATRELIVDGFSLMLRYLQQLKAEQKSQTAWMNFA